jgi:4a-hydroxytetrahydrobiopterin dehydratase
LFTQGEVGCLDTRSAASFKKVSHRIRKKSRNQREIMPALLEPEAVQTLLPEVPDWKLEENAIIRTFEFASFPLAIDFVNKVAEEAEKANHHPDIDIRWRNVRLALSTHSVGGLTSADFTLARKLDQLYAQFKG